MHTGHTALYIACSSAHPDLQLVSALVAAGASATQPCLVDGNTPLLLSVKAGGEAGLALAKALLLSEPCMHQQQHQQPGTLWCSLSADTTSTGSSSCAGGSDGVNTANITGETAVSVAAAAVQRELGEMDVAAAPAAVAQGLVKLTPEQELLALLLSSGSKLPQGVAVTLLHQGLAGRLSDKLTSQVSLLFCC